MAYSVHIDDGSGAIDVFQLATGRGLVLFGEWVDSLPVGGFEVLRSFIQDGESESSDILSDQLRTALEDHPPDDESVRHTASDLAERLGVGHPEESVVIVG